MREKLKIYRSTFARRCPRYKFWPTKLINCFGVGRVNSLIGFLLCTDFGVWLTVFQCGTYIHDTYIQFIVHVINWFHCQIIDSYWRVAHGEYHRFSSPSVGSWIKVQFDQTYHLTFLRILPSPLKSQGGIKHLNVTFSDGSYMQVMW